MLSVVCKSIRMCYKIGIHFKLLPLAFTIHLFNVDTIQGREVTGPDLYWKPSREIWDVIWGIEPTTLNSEHITIVVIDFFSLKIVTKVNSWTIFFLILTFLGCIL